jgi:subtilase family serine protease
MGDLAMAKKTIAAVGGMSMPPVMQSNHAVVVGLNSFIRMQSQPITRAAVSEDSPSNLGPYRFDNLKEAYDFPSFKVLTGKGANIAILQSGAFLQSDMDLYFGHEKLATPHITEVDINGGAPFDPANSRETTLDLQQAGGMAPGANLTLYNVPDLSDFSLLTGLDSIIQSNTVDVVNMSFTASELFYTPAYNNGTDFTQILQVYDDMFKQGNAQGITFVAASGDWGALATPAVACLDVNAQPGCGGFVPSVGSPASDPHVTAVGGTNLVTTLSSTSLDSRYVREEAFADPLSVDIFYGTPATGAFFGSGGGESVIFDKPGYQYLVPTGSKARTIPDVSLHMGGCPLRRREPCLPDRSTDLVVVGGQSQEVIGTSASSPDFAGFLALKIQQLGTRLGNENYALYALSALQQIGFPLNIFNNDIQGFNGVYSTHKGYNFVLGNGSVNGVNYLLAPGVPTAGTPQTPSNP